MDYKRLVRYGDCLRGSGMTVFYEGARGLLIRVSASRRIGGAVRRSCVKRWMRVILRDLLQGKDFHLLAVCREKRDWDYEECLGALKKVLRPLL